MRFSQEKYDGSKHFSLPAHPQRVAVPAGDFAISPNTQFHITAQLVSEKGFSGKSTSVIFDKDLRTLTGS